MANAINRNFNLSLGEVDAAYSENLAGGSKLTAYRLANMYYYQNHLWFTPSTAKIDTIPLAAGDTIGRSYICIIRKWAIISVLHSNGTATLYVYQGISSRKELTTRMRDINSTIAPTTINIPTLSAYDLSFTEVESTNFSLNNVQGASAILIFGSDLLYYLDNRLTLQTYMFTAKAGNHNFPKPLYGCIFQARLFLVGQGFNLINNAASTLTSSVYHTYSRIIPYNLESMSTVFNESGDPPTLITDIAQSHNVVKTGDEVIYGISDFMNRLVITTSRRVLNISSGTGETDQVSAVNFSITTTSNVECYPGEATLYESFLVYPSVHGMRQQMSGGMLLQYFQLLDQRAMTYRDLKVSRLIADPSKASLLAITKDGVAKTLYWSSLAMNQQPVMSITTYYISDLRPCLGLARTPSSINDMIIVRTADGTGAIVAQEIEETASRLAIHAWTPGISISSFNASTRQFTVTSYNQIDQSTGMIGLWFLSDNNHWHYAIRLTSSGNTYQLLPTDNLNVAVGTYFIIPDTSNLANQIPAAEKAGLSAGMEEGLRLDIDINAVNADGTALRLELIHEIWTSLCVNQRIGFSGTVVMELSYKMKNPAIEWYSGASYKGAPVIVTDFVLLTNDRLHDGYDVSRDQSIIKATEGEDSAYYSYKFANNANVGNNITKLQFINKSKNINKASINQLLVLPLK